MLKKGIYITRKGRPSDPGYEMAGFKDINLETLEMNLEMAEKYTDPESEESLINERHPNRNLDKPDIDKPRYS
ncbi:MAG TPA: hypothetical protein VNW99_08170 [Cytophagaceae bacterium]|nr:hypothetical protein [Cytophagaceae bacterium]